MMLSRFASGRGRSRAAWFLTITVDPPPAGLAELRGESPMSRSILRTVLASFFVLAFLVSCSDQKEPAKSETKVTAGEVKSETKEALDTAKAYTDQQKEEYLGLMKTKMEDLDRQIEGLQAKAAEVKAESKTEFDQAMNDLRAKREAAAAKYESLKSASAAAWGDMKTGMDAAADDLGNALKNAEAHFKQ
jgi:hypothetical protein